MGVSVVDLTPDREYQISAGGFRAAALRDKIDPNICAAGDGNPGGALGFKILIFQQSAPS
jgi:hypothetical protein